MEELVRTNRNNKVCLDELSGLHWKRDGCLTLRPELYYSTKINVIMEECLYGVRIGTLHTPCLPLTFSPYTF